MPKLAVASATLIMVPGNGWLWSSLEPVEAKVPDVEDSILRVEGNFGVLPHHLALIPSKLTQPIAFDVLATPDGGLASVGGTPGTLNITELKADQHSLSQLVRNGSESYLTASTTGTFSATVIVQAMTPPAASAFTGPAVGGSLKGTWSIKTTPQEILVVA